jgi:copper(I)-binding protein
VSRYSRRAIAVVGVLAVAPLMSACAAGQHPQSALPTQLAEGVNASVNQVDIRNVFLLGPLPGQRLAVGSSAPIYAWFVNNGGSPDRLVAAEAPGVAQSVQIAGGAVALPPNQLVNTIQSPGAQQSPSTTATPTPATTPTKGRAAKPRGKAGARSATPTVTVTPQGTATPGAPMPGTPAQQSPSKLILTGLTKNYTGGETFKLTLHFQQAGTVTLNVPVVPRSGYYATYSPVPAAPSATPTPSATPLPRQSKSPSKNVGKGGKKKASATPSA